MNADVSRKLQVFRIRYAEPLLRQAARFWSWWSDQLVHQLPAEMQDAIARRDERLFIFVDDQFLVIRQTHEPESTEMQRLRRDNPAGQRREFRNDPNRQVLVIPKDKVLRTMLKLPLAAEENLDEVIAFEMDKHTPFPVDKVCYDYRVREWDVDNQQLHVELFYTRRDIVADVVDAAGKHGLRPATVTSSDMAGDNLLDVNLLPAESLAGGRRLEFRLNAVLAVTCVALLAIAVALPLWQQHTIIESVRPQVAQAAEIAKQGSELRRDVEALAAGTKILEDKKRSRLLIVQLIDEVSRILPDHTWLSRLDIAGSELQLQGQSSSAAELVAIVESSGMLHNARFRSPVIQIPGTSEERFHMSADIVWGPEQ